MADRMPQVNKLAAALKSVGPVTLQGGHFDSDGNAVGDLHYPEGVASLLETALADAGGLLILPANAHPVVLPCEPERDPELALMAQILRGMETLDPEARQRVRNWVDERFVPRRFP